MTKIEWTEKTWNPVVGCSIVSPGCTNCYAMKMARRLELMGSTQFPQYVGTTKLVNGNSVWTGKVAHSEGALLQPLRRKKPTMYFVNSMGDLFHEDIPDAWIDQVFAVMAMTPQHTYQVLTKRPERMRAYFARRTVPHYEPEFGDDDLAPSESAILLQMVKLAGTVAAGRPFTTPTLPLDNVWLGTSCERQQEADARIPDLLATPAAVRFVSAEPLLGPIDFRSPIYHDAIGYSQQGYLRDSQEFDDYRYHSPKLDWIIVGGESGPGARPMHPDWARSLRDQCRAAGTAFFFKQFGEHEPTVAAVDYQDYAVLDADAEDLRDAAARCEIVWPDGRRVKPERRRDWWGEQDFGDAMPGEPGGPVIMRRVGKGIAGRLLDGRTWDEMPRQAQRDAA